MDLEFAAAWFYPLAVFDMERAPVAWTFSNLDVALNAALNSHFCRELGIPEPTPIEDYRSDRPRFAWVDGVELQVWLPRYFPDDSSNFALSEAKNIFVLGAMQDRLDQLDDFTRESCAPVNESEIESVLAAGKAILYPSQYRRFTEWLVVNAPSFPLDPDSRIELFSSWVGDVYTTEAAYAHDVARVGGDLFAFSPDQVGQLRQIVRVPRS